MIHKYRYAVRACVHMLLAAVIFHLNGSDDLHAGARAKGNGAGWGFFSGPGHQVLMKKLVLICRRWTFISPTTSTTLVNGRGRQVGRVEEDGGELNWVTIVPKWGEPVTHSQNFERRTRRTQKQLDSLLKRGVHMHRRGHPISLVFCLFSSSRCLFIVLAHKQDRRPVAKINSENVEGIWRSEEKTLCKGKCAARSGWIAHAELPKNNRTCCGKTESSPPSLRKTST